MNFYWETAALMLICAGWLFMYFCAPLSAKQLGRLEELARENAVVSSFVRDCLAEGSRLRAHHLRKAETVARRAAVLEHLAKEREERDAILHRLRSQQSDTAAPSE